MPCFVIIFLLLYEGKINSFTHPQPCFLFFGSDVRRGRQCIEGVAMFEDSFDYYHMLSCSWAITECCFL